MITRRAFIMASLSALGVGCVGAASLLLRRGSTPTPNQPAAEGPFAPVQTPTPYQPPAPSLAAAAELQPTPYLVDAPACTDAAQAPISRSAWGAAEPAVTADGWGEHGPYSAANPDGWMVYNAPLEEVYHTIIVHHSALPLSDGPLEIQKLHMEEKGFADIGYHYLINEKGQLFEGRAINVRGAHTFAHNYGAIGICLIGNFEVIQPSQAQIEMLQSLMVCLLGQYPNIRNLAGHRDYNPGVTLCPGENLAPFLPVLAQRFNLVFGG